MSEFQAKPYPNLLLVAGTGRNSGKTSFVCRICETWNHALPLVCIKISNHIHLQAGTKLLYALTGFTIYEETQVSTDKDTERMLKAGASKVLFIEADREYVFPAFQKALEVVPSNSAIICESGTLRRYVKPSLFVMMHTSGTEPKESAKDLFPMADKVFYFEAGNLILPDHPVVYVSNHWKLNNVYVPG